MANVTKHMIQCAHCGEDCADEQIKLGDIYFCCTGCKMVYQLLNNTGLCDYYTLNDKPGINQRKPVRNDKFSFLDDPVITQKLISFCNTEQTRVTFYLPQMHCSSCLYLLENLHKLDRNIISSTVTFQKKEVAIILNNKISLRDVAELLTSIGYEPYISLANLGKHKPKSNRKMIYRLGIAGFCFANIMLMSFPEYLGLNHFESDLQFTFRLLNLILALPVFFYSAQPFYQTAWKGLLHKYLNIDAPIALAIIVTFGRSLFEVITGAGPGYFDSLTGIVFFMLVGRVLQDKTYQQLSFERDYTSYFPIAVSVLKEGKQIPTPLPEIKVGDTLLIHNEELIPADGILTKGKALIDYSFISGEAIPVLKEMGEIVYAGGRQTGGSMDLLVMKEVSQSYLTSLWAMDAAKKEQKKQDSFIQILSRYFTFIVFGIAISTALYWWANDIGKIWNSVIAVLIIACPCALLLSSSFTNGNILRILGKNHFYLRNAEVIENIASISQIVFDKTGTLTITSEQQVEYHGVVLSKQQKEAFKYLAAQSSHPLNKMLVKHLEKSSMPKMKIQAFKEYVGKGIEGFINNELYAIGSSRFITGQSKKGPESTCVYISQEGKLLGRFEFHNQYRKKLRELIDQLQPHYTLSVVSGDNEGEGMRLKNLIGENITLLFNQQPEDKLLYIDFLQNRGDKVMMIGDGLNDAAALKQSEVGIAITEDSNNFTPASDAILEANQLPQLNNFLRLCRVNKKIIIASFILSILYNIIGLGFAVQGNLSPLVAAILMPASSISIILTTFGLSNLIAKFLHL